VPRGGRRRLSVRQSIRLHQHCVLPCASPARQGRPCCRRPSSACTPPGRRSRGPRLQTRTCFIEQQHHQWCFPPAIPPPPPGTDHACMPSPQACESAVAWSRAIHGAGRRRQLGHAFKARPCATRRHIMVRWIRGQCDVETCPWQRTCLDGSIAGAVVSCSMVTATSATTALQAKYAQCIHPYPPSEHGSCCGAFRMLLSGAPGCFP
jgi:hypothetical protein